MYMDPVRVVTTVAGSSPSKTKLSPAMAKDSAFNPEVTMVVPSGIDGWQDTDPVTSPLFRLMDQFVIKGYCRCAAVRGVSCHGSGVFVFGVGDCCVCGGGIDTDGLMLVLMLLLPIPLLLPLPFNFCSSSFNFFWVSESACVLDWSEDRLTSNRFFCSAMTCSA